MFDRLDRISDRTAYLAVALGLGASLLAAVLMPQDAQLGAWVRLVIWHGMLSTACIVGIFTMGALAVAFLVAGDDRLGEWARALQVALLPLWVLASTIGAVAARLVWNGWNLSERRMMMSIAYIVVAAVALMVTLLREGRRTGAIAQTVSALAMAAGLAWIALGPAGEDVHPASAVLSSPDIAFKFYAAVMLLGCLLTVLALVVPVRHWLQRAEDHSVQRT
jgi:magnesium-transporting ATPase (P-type)